MPHRTHRRHERGEGRIKLLLALAVIAAAVYVALQFIPVYMHSLQMQDATQEVVRQAALQNLREPDVRARLHEKATEFSLPSDVKIDVARNGKKVSAHVTYTQTITLPFYTYRWPFDFRKEETGF